MLMPMTYIGKELATFYLWTKEGNDRAIDLVDRALKLEPNFVPAIILAENCWALRHTNGWSPLADAREKSAHYARLAVQLDPDNAEALAILSRRTSFINQAHEEAMTLAERAVAINPNSAFAWRNSGFAFAFGGVPDKALAHFERAMRLSLAIPARTTSYTAWHWRSFSWNEIRKPSWSLARRSSRINFLPLHGGR